MDTFEKFCHYYAETDNVCKQEKVSLVVKLLEMGTIPKGKHAPNEGYCGLVSFTGSAKLEAGKMTQLLFDCVTRPLKVEAIPN